MSFYVAMRARKSGEEVWTVHRMFRSKDGTRSTQHIKKSTWLTWGFHAEMTPDEARSHCQTLNHQTNAKLEQERKAAALERVNTVVRIKSTWLPDHDCTQFEKKILEGKWGAERGDANKVFVRWHIVQGIIAELDTHPRDWAEYSASFYKLFRERQWSVDYVRKLLRILNAWGGFYCRIYSTYYEPLLMPTGRDRAKISDAQRDAPGRKAASEPLTFSALGRAHSRLATEEYKWLFVSIAFGLRPEEVDSLVTETAKDKKWKVMDRIDHVKQRKYKALRVYQYKLTAVAFEKRFKYIELKYDFQLEALRYIEDGALTRPHNHDVRAITEGATCYGGRKNFDPMMHERHGETLEQVAAWLGHQDTSTLFAHYHDMQGGLSATEKEPDKWMAA